MALAGFMTAVTPRGHPPSKEEGEASRRESVIARTPEARAAIARQLAEARLRFAAPLLILAIGGLCLRDSVIGGRSLSVGELTLVVLASIATASLFAPGLPSKAVPRIEVAVIWFAGAYLALRAYDPRNWGFGVPVPDQALRHLDHAAVSLGLLIVAYAIAVPNSPRRAAIIVLPLALAPLAVSLARLLVTPQVVNVGGLVGMLMTDALLVPVAATSLGLYGTYLLDRYRSQLEQAKDEGRYQLVRQIGSGGMGEVWLAHHHLLARPVALKLIRAERLGHRRQVEVAWQRFEREAQAIASLRSPHTVELYDFGVTTDEVFYYVMEYLPGVDLERLVERHGPVPVERAVYLLRQVCDSLGDAHAHGLVHRDVKPANIVICRMGAEHDYVKVLDFGLVKSLRDAPINEGVTAENIFLGTPAYAAPEIACGGSDVTGAADIYSLGCVAYWLLTGKTVFDSQGAGAMLADHIKSRPRPPSERIRSWIPAELEAVVMRCLEKDPATRYATPGELDTALGGCPVRYVWDRHRARTWWELNDVRRHDLDAAT